MHKIATAVLQSVEDIRYLRDPFESKKKHPTRAIPMHKNHNPCMRRSDLVFDFYRIVKGVDLLPACAEKLLLEAPTVVLPVQVLEQRTLLQALRMVLVVPTRRSFGLCLARYIVTLAK